MYAALWNHPVVEGHAAPTGVLATQSATITFSPANGNPFPINETLWSASITCTFASSFAFESLTVPCAPLVMEDELVQRVTCSLAAGAWAFPARNAKATVQAANTTILTAPFDFTGAST